MKKAIVISIFLISSISLFAQNSVDALRYSQTYNGGTARYLAMGGAFGALGGDLSVMGSNPAGLAIFRSSQISFTPTVYFGNSLSSMNSSSISGRKDNFNINNFAAVFASRFNEDKSGWKSFQFGIGLNRLNNYNSRYNIENHNSTASLITDYQDQAYGLYPSALDAFTTDLAWKTYMFQDTVWLNNGALAYTSALNKGGALEKETITRKGSSNELNFSFAGSYNDKIYIGASIGFPNIRYFEDVSYNAVDDADTLLGFKSFTMNRHLETMGNGVNFKMGLIFRPSPYLRLGVNFESPTWYSLHDTYYNDMNQVMENGNTYDAASPTGNFDYNLTTPMKIGFGAGVIVGHFMVLSGDINYKDYSAASLSSTAYSFSNENNDVNAKYQAAMDLKAGAEFNLNPIALRIGYANYGNPYISTVNQYSRWDASAGIGYRENNFTLDFAYIYSKSSENYYMYDPVFVDPTSTELNTHKILISVGLKF